MQQPIKLSSLRTDELRMLAENLAIHIDDVIHPDLGDTPYKNLVDTLTDPTANRKRLTGAIHNALGVFEDCGVSASCDLPAYLDAAKHKHVRPREFLLVVAVALAGVLLFRWWNKQKGASMIVGSHNSSSSAYLRGVDAQIL